MSSKPKRNHAKPKQQKNSGIHQVLHKLYTNLPANAGNAGDMGSIPGSRRSSRVGNGKPLQYSPLENSMDRGAQLATVHKVANSGTQLSVCACACARAHTHTHTHTRSVCMLNPIALTVIPRRQPTNQTISLTMLLIIYAGSLGKCKTLYQSCYPHTTL